MINRSFRVLAVALLVALGGAWGLSGSITLDAPAYAQSSGNVPGDVLGNKNDSDFWRDVRHGAAGKVTIVDQNAAVMINSSGEDWRLFKNGALSSLGGWGMLAMLVVLAAYFAYRGKIKVESGMSGKTVVRFALFERFSHWLTAISFVWLGLTGLNVMYGRYVLKPILGADAFAAITYFGKFTHDWVGFAFMVGVVLLIVLWFKNNIPNASDIRWMARLGGMLSKTGQHIPARKFNAGQKVVYWVVFFGGISISLTGLALLMPYEISLFSGTFAFLNVFGLGLPTDLTVLQETQLALLWHSLVALGLVIIMFGHIYLGTIGMEGAFDSMYSGDVDENWAREHHSLWADELGIGSGEHTSEQAGE